MERVGVLMMNGDRVAETFRGGGGGWRASGIGGLLTRRLGNSLFGTGLLTDHDCQPVPMIGLHTTHQSHGVRSPDLDYWLYMFFSSQLQRRPRHRSVRL